MRRALSREVARLPSLPLLLLSLPLPLLPILDRVAQRVVGYEPRVSHREPRHRAGEAPCPEPSFDAGALVAVPVRHRDRVRHELT